MIQSAPVNPALSAWIRLLKVHNLVLRKARMKLGAQCTMAQFDILAQLSREKDGTPLVELSRKLLVTAGNVTGIIDRMERLGLVKRRPDPNDRRVTRVHLTLRGRQLAKRVMPKHARDIDSIFSTLSKQEAEQLRELLEKLLQSLESSGTLDLPQRR